ncbi:Rv1733c family protein [Kitasatospora sp. NPDC001660]
MTTPPEQTDLVPPFRRHLRQALGKDRNPLGRPIDRSHSRALVLAVLGIGLAVLGSAGAAAADFAVVRHQASVTAARLHQVQAVVLAPAQRRSGADTGGRRYEADAVWVYPAGKRTTGNVPVPGGTAPGSTVGLWVDDTGRSVAPPLGSAAAAAKAACLGLFVLGGLGALIVTGLGIRLDLLDRRADLAWQHSWALLEPVWSGRASRDNRTG